MENKQSSDPFETLGVAPSASEAEIRARYLELVRRFPPEREPSRFREIRAAFEAANDPLLLARRLLAPPDETPPEWNDAIEEHRRKPPALKPEFLLSLGNRDSSPGESREGADE
jgi:curved DNA-binding protein CbpA